MIEDFFLRLDYLLLLFFVCLSIDTNESFVFVTPETFEISSLKESEGRSFSYFFSASSFSIPLLDEFK